VLKNSAKKMFEQKRFAGKHLLTFESQKLNYFGKMWGRRFDITMQFVVIKLKKKHTSKGIVKKKRTKPTKEF
jgi:hypothetical protein